MTDQQNNEQLSKCCKASVVVTHGCDSDFGHGEKKCNCEVVTMWNECAKCKQPCDINLNNEEWEKEFDNKCMEGLFGAGIDVFNMKEFIRQQRQEAYSKGHNDGADMQIRLDHDLNYPAIKKQAVREFAEYLADSIPKALTCGWCGKDSWECFCEHKIYQALEVYEGKIQ